jgi:hypothetical protein
VREKWSRKRFPKMAKNGVKSARVPSSRKYAAKYEKEEKVAMSAQNPARL